jgi:hypothetical protein
MQIVLTFYKKTLKLILEKSEEQCNLQIQQLSS